MTTNIATLSKQLLAGDRRALARAVSIVESGGPNAALLSKELFVYCGRAHILGITGSPGVGKSTLVDALVTHMRKAGFSVAVLAIDPSSPFSGGAILGDRIRMQGHTLDKGVFIRSMANRGHPGGIALATYDTVRMLEAAGFDLIIIETVGVGQSELSIAETADTTILTLMPSAGDDVQAIKSGIMEIGDIYVLNKSDLPGAQKSYADIAQSLELRECKTAWRPPVLMTTAETGEGTKQVWAGILAHKEFLASTGQLHRRRQSKTQAELMEIIAERARSNFLALLNDSPEAQKILTQVVDLTIDPHSAADLLLKQWLEQDWLQKDAPRKPVDKNRCEK